ncbi:unnamed protein product [Sphagnum balticum]
MAALRRTLSSTKFEQEGFIVPCASSCAIRVSPLQQQQQQQQQHQQSCVVLSPVSAVVSQGFALFPLSLLRLGINNSSQGMADRAGKSSSRRSPWKRFPIVLGMCFILGVLLGLLTPDNWTSSSSSDTAKSGQDLASSDFIEGIKVENVASSGEVANALEETSGIGSHINDMCKLASGLQYGFTKVLEPHKLLIVVTPTYNRAFQAYYLTRLAHTLKLVPPPFLWIVVEMGAQSLETASLLRQTGIMYRHLVCEKNLTNIKDRGIHQRNVALAHIEQHQLDGIVYFADDDNVYTLELFEELRQIRRFGTWLVGMLAHSKSRTVLEGPVCDGEKVIGWHTNEKSKRLRRFHVDMSGFAFNSTILWDPDRWHRPSLDPIRQLDTVKEGFQETTFIEQLVADESQMEGRPPGCSKVMVWHLHLETVSGLPYPSGWRMNSPLSANLPLQQDA